MSEINTPAVDNNHWNGSAPPEAGIQSDLEAQRKLYEQKRESEKQLIYNQLTANDYKGSSKERGARMAALVAQHRFVI